MATKKSNDKSPARNSGLTAYGAGQMAANRMGFGDNKAFQTMNATLDPAGGIADAGIGASERGWNGMGGFEGGRKKGEKQIGLDDSNVSQQFDANEIFKGMYQPKESMFRAQQNGLAQMLMQRATGQAPSLTDAIARQQQTQGMANISSQTASQRGVNNAFAARGAQNAAASLSGQLAQQRMMGNIQEQQSAQQSLAGVLSGARDQDNAFQQLKMNQDLQPRQASFQEALQRQNLNAQGQLAARGTRFNNWNQQQQTGAQMMGGIGSIVGMSDETEKHNIQEISKADVHEFLSAIKPKTYEYNNSAYGEGERIGFVLQDVKDTKLGKKLVVVRDGKLMYDKDNLNGIILAALAFNQAG